jgi:Tol biopolymer transport system component
MLIPRWLFIATFFGLVSCNLQPTVSTRINSSTPMAVPSESGEENSQNEEPKPPECPPTDGLFRPSGFSWSPDNQQLAYTSAGYIYVVQVGNPIQNNLPAQVERLSDSNLEAIQLAWSPNGDYIAFVSQQDGTFIEGGRQIYLLDMNTGEAKRLTNSPGSKEGLIWSPDGRYLAYSTYRLDSFDEAQVRVTDIYNNEEIVLTELGVGGHQEPFSWSPDSHYLAYHSTEDGYETVQIFITDLSGNNRIQLSDPTACDAEPRWSPDGRRIAFISLLDDNWELFVMNADGSQRTRLTSSEGTDEYYPKWSPDGKQIAFVAWNWSIAASEKSNNAYLVNVDDSNLRPLTDSGLSEEHLAWSPDGQYIAAVAHPIIGETPVYIDLVKVQTGERINLTTITAR